MQGGGGKDMVPPKILKARKRGNIWAKFCQFFILLFFLKIVLPKCTCRVGNAEHVLKELLLLKC